MSQPHLTSVTSRLPAFDLITAEEAALLAANTRANGKVLMSPGAQHHEQPLPQEPILGAGYVRHPAPAPAHAALCAQCLACRSRALAQMTPATGEKA
jgi:hypothetical protein